MTRIRAAALAAFAALAGGWPAPARAETVAAKWDSYFYAAPRGTAPVLDEVQRAAKIDVGSCKDGWCRVRYGETEGYVREEVVRGPDNAVLPGGRAPGAACFEAAQPGGGAWQTERFCRSGG